MKLSTETIEILKNFAAINPSLLIKPGNVLKTVHSKKTILASAKLKESFPSEAPINDLTRLLMVISASCGQRWSVQHKAVAWWDCYCHTSTCEGHCASQCRSHIYHRKCSLAKCYATQFCACPSKYLAVWA